MLVLVSPAKTLAMDGSVSFAASTQPAFLPSSQILVEQLRKLAPHELSQLMTISDKLGVLNYDRYQQWRLPFTAQNSRQAILAFKGDVYLGMEADSFSKADFRFAQSHLRILSGLYGLLKPLDLIQAYRLEMGTRLANARGKDLYAFWGSEITTALNAELKPKDIIVNLASNEYYKVVREAELQTRVVTPVFMEHKQGNYKIVSFFAKRARGAMAAYIIKNRLKSSAGIKSFDWCGYEFHPELSNDGHWVFAREQPEGK